jgi:carbonic anhydrase
MDKVNNTTEINTDELIGTKVFIEAILNVLFDDIPEDQTEEDALRDFVDVMKLMPKSVENAEDITPEAA